MSRPWLPPPGAHPPEDHGLAGNGLVHYRLAITLDYELRSRTAPRCVCGHTELVHRHHRRGIDCAVCECPAFRRPLREDLAHLYDHTREHLVPALVRRWKRRLHNLTRLLDILEIPMAPDRDLITALAQTIPAIVGGVDALAEDRDQWRTRALAAEGREATDEADDVVALQPLKDGLAAILAKVAPAAPPATDPVPIEDVPAVVDAAPEAPAADPADPGPVPDATS